MTEEQEKQGEKIASGVMRVLAITGLVAILALAAWLLVQSVHIIPKAGNGFETAASVLKSVFSNQPQENLSFSLDARTFEVQSPTTLSWEYVGESTPEQYSFSYSCAEDVSLSIKGDMGWAEQECDAPFETENQYVQMIASSPTLRFVDTELTLKADELTDTIVVTIINNAANPPTVVTQEETTEIEDEPTTVVAEEPILVVTETSSETETPAVTTTGDSDPIVITPTPVTPPTVVTSGPSDLSISIDETGVLIPVTGRDTFFAISPIPSDRTAAVTFTVSNLGGTESGAWGFVANLPTISEDDYRYVSPIQESLDPNTKITFTLGFTEILDESEGTIRIELLPASNDDKSSNNTDVVSIEIDND